MVIELVPGHSSPVSDPACAPTFKTVFHTYSRVELSILSGPPLIVQRPVFRFLLTSSYLFTSKNEVLFFAGEKDIKLLMHGHKQNFAFTHRGPITVISTTLFHDIP